MYLAATGSVDKEYCEGALLLIADERVAAAA
jgi:hypothetical protein